MSDIFAPGLAKQRRKLLGAFPNVGAFPSTHGMAGLGANTVTPQVQAAIQAIAVSLGDTSLVTSITQDYINNDPATVTQVQYYMSQGSGTSSLTTYLLYGLGAFLAYRLFAGKGSFA